MPYGAEMAVSAGNNVRRDRISEDEVEDHQAISLLGLIRLRNAEERILDVEDVIVVKKQVVSQIEGAGKSEEFLRSLSKM